MFTKFKNDLNDNVQRTPNRTHTHGLKVAFIKHRLV